MLEVPPSVEMEPVLTETHPLRASLEIEGQLVPLAEKYKYLGIVLSAVLEIKSMVARRRKLGWARVTKLHQAWADGAESYPLPR